MSRRVNTSHVLRAAIICSVVLLALVPNGLVARGDTAGAAVAFPVHGLNFSPFIDGQDPATGITVPLAQLEQRIALVAPYTRWIRTFGCTHGLQPAGAIAHRLGLKAAVGAWLGRDAAANDAEIQCLVDVVNGREADLAIVGSEVLLRRDLGADALVEAIDSVRARTGGRVPVATADIDSELVQNPSVIDAGDVVLANFYPFWAGLPISQAVATLHTAYEDLQAVAGGKQVIVSETGWPSGGDPVGQAVPSLPNACAYFLHTVSWAEAQAVDLFYFSALDESWKVREEGTRGATWGILDKNGGLKTCMQPVFNGTRAPAVLWRPDPPGGPGTPVMAFTSVPPVDSTQQVSGTELHVSSADVRIAPYIRVGTGWWTKPTFASPRVPVRPDGTWSFPYVTGGSDQRATAIAVFLIPSDYFPPAVSGQWYLPQELEENALARLEAIRTIVSLGPTSPQTNDVLTANASSDDGFGGTLQFTYRWTVNGVMKRVTGPTTATTDNFDLSQPGNADGGDTVAVEVTPSNGHSTAVAGSASVQVAPTSLAARYLSLTPSRVLDTRNGTGGISGPVGPGASVDVQMTGRGGIPARGVSAVAVNVTATRPTGAGWLTVWPTGDPRPLASNLNFTSGETVPNLVVVKVGTGGKVSLFNSAGASHVVFDVAGWFANADAGVGNEGRYSALPPARILDTRNGTGGGVRLAPGASIDLQVSGRGGVPAAGAGAAVLNVAVTNTTATSFLTVFPTGQVRPLASNLNFVGGDTVANRVMAKLGTGGKVTIYNDAGSTDVIVDVGGWYSDAALVGVTGTYTPLAPARILDTRSATGGVSGPIAGRTAVDVQVAGLGGVPASGVSAVILNATVVEPAAAGWLTISPTGSARPVASDLNYAAGHTRSNLVVVKLGTGGKVNLFTQATTNVVFDVAGWFS